MIRIACANCVLLLCHAVGAALLCSQEPAAPRYEQRDPDAVHFRRHLASIRQAADRTSADRIANWSLVHREDQRIVYFLTDEPLEPTAFNKLRQQRANNLLRHAGGAVESDDRQSGYRLFWQAAREDPRNPKVLRALGLSASGETPISVRPGRSADRQLNWPARTYLQIQSPHFTIDARCDRAQGRQLAQQLEQIYWIWTQVFYPLWENPTAIKETLTGEGRFESRINRHRVVVFPNRQEYIDALSKNTPGIERSTGYYSNHARITFLYLGADADLATRYHELTHQLLGEATRMRVSAEVGLPSDFWVIEGTASYMESLRFHDTFATVGGWESPRLQFARYRVRGLGETMPLQRLVAQGRDAVQQSPDIAGWYSYAAAYTHRFMDSDDRDTFLDYVRNCYEQPAGRRSLPDVELTQFLQVTDRQVNSLRLGTQLKQLCLTGTAVGDDAIDALETQQQLNWLDLSRLAFQDESMARLISRNPDLDQLSLERTAAGEQTLAAIVRLRQLQELDLTLTATSDEQLDGMEALSALQTLWLTATKITDEGLKRIERLPKLQQIDVQGTRVTPAAIESLRAARPTLKINPLTVIAPQGGSSG